MITNKEKIGLIGENLVKNYLDTNCIGAVLSEDKYDRIKDMLQPNGAKVEVKTKTIIKKTQCFWLEKNQWNKIDNADRTFFLTIPLNYNDSICYYEIKDKSKYTIIKDKYGNQVRQYFIKDLKHVFTNNDSNDIMKLYNLSESLYKD